MSQPARRHQELRYQLSDEPVVRAVFGGPQPVLAWIGLFDVSVGRVIMADIEKPSGHPAAVTVQAVWPPVESAEREHNADAAKANSHWAQQGIDSLDRAANHFRESWKGQSGDAALGEIAAIKHKVQQYQSWQNDSRRVFEHTASLTRTFKRALYDVFDRAKEAYDAVPDCQQAEGLRKAVIAEYTAEARDTETFYVEQAQAIQLPAHPDLSYLPAAPGGGQQSHGNSDGRAKAKPMDDHSSIGKSSGGDGSGERKGKSGGKTDAEKHGQTRTGKSSGDDKGVAHDNADGAGPTSDDTHTTTGKTSGDDGGAGQTGIGQSPVGAGSSPFGAFSPMSAMGGMSPGAGGMGGGSPMQGLSGLQGLGSGFQGFGSGLNPAAGLQGAGQSVQPAVAANPLTSFGQGFGSGLSAASGAGPIAPATPAGPIQQASQFVSPVARPEVPVAPPASVPGVVNAAGVGASEAAPAAPGSGSGPAGPVGGGGGMLAPYSAPTSGVGGGGGTPPPTTGPATPGTPPPSSSGGSATTMAPLPPPDDRVMPARAGRNPDLVLAEKVVADLLRGAPMAAVEWAVSVVRTGAGPQVYVASSVAGGSFVPQGVFLPSVARLAAMDPALPANWWAPFVGWGRPVDMLLEHYGQLSAAVSGGVMLSAVATTVVRDARLPAHVRAEFAVVGRQGVSGSAPSLGGARQHRLATIDPALYSRLRGLRPEVSMVAAVGVTNAVVAAARNVADANEALATETDNDMLVKVAKQGVTEQDWVTYKEAANLADLELTTSATHSFDDEPQTQREREKYLHLFRRARVMELVTCWEKPLAPSLPDIVYNALHAGYQPAQIIDQAEQQSLAGART